MGTACPGGEFVFVGFEAGLVSHVEKVAPEAGETPKLFTGSFKVGTTSEAFAVNLYPGDAWLRIVDQDRTNPLETEHYDLPVVAYVRFHPVKFLFGKIELDIHISSGLWFPHATGRPPVISEKDDYGEYELSDDDYKTK